jgi:hypothetical protein
VRELTKSATDQGGGPARGTGNARMDESR